MTTALTLSAIQYTALDGGVAANVPEHIRLIEDAADHGARLVVFPELSLTGYDLDGLADPERWVTAADPRLDSLREICRRTGITAVVGAPFRESDGTPRLASLALQPGGGLDAGFKVWLHGPERQSFTPGDRTAVLDLDGWRIALAICLDTARPVHAGEAAEAGADIYAVSALYAAGEAHRLALHLGARAMDHRMFSVLANLGGTTEFGPSAGGSGFWGPDGLVIRQAAGTGTEVVTATLQHGVLDRYDHEREAGRRQVPAPGTDNG
ncbi:carbon-nitrogen hydrolase family protein [Arthrobacter sp. NicSoilB4]|uniref:carbon-nitrogen hydrolase family protein n=1 Tax=Arthrobacter sp. NicSoilB4 TaxID=2830997 RepID=UPI001CC5E327|nr:carbon-nitrogen hydrolase family protein [Arthrobacter sp. NicSoilB4]BCW66455.1 carbon-nitrogen hydrolase family protein [Arthrobacter sp. NicSoilB4]